MLLCVGRAFWAKTQAFCGETSGEASVAPWNELGAGEIPVLTACRHWKDVSRDLSKTRSCSRILLRVMTWSDVLIKGPAGCCEKGMWGARVEAGRVLLQLSRVETIVAEWRQWSEKQ